MSSQPKLLEICGYQCVVYEGVSDAVHSATVISSEGSDAAEVEKSSRPKDASYKSISAPSPTYIYCVGVDGQAMDRGFPVGSVSSTIVLINVPNWDDDMTPWTAPGLYRGDAPFGGKADHMLDVILGNIAPAVEGERAQSAKRALAGYSLGGLFSTYGFLTRAEVNAFASMSGSLWYEGWLDYLNGLEGAHRDVAGKFAFFSLGDRERKAMPEILHDVQRNTEQTARILEDWGMRVEYELTEGGHFDHVTDRIAAGLLALDQGM